MKRSRKIKKPNSTSQANLILEEVIGLTTKNANGLASAVSSSKCAYIAGCVVVVYDVGSGTQSNLLVSHRMPKSLCCVGVSRDSSFIAAGESGDQPAVLLWKASTPTLLGELKGHQYGVACLAFSPDGKHLASVGYANDGCICLWDLRTQTILTKIKACSAVASVSFSLDAKFIVTVGRKHLKLWKVELPTRSRPNTRAISTAINGKPLNVGHHQGYSFIAVAYPHWTNKSFLNNTLDNGSPIYALADTGILFILSSGLAITNSVDLKVKKGMALSTSSRLVACACNNGIVKLYTVSSLQYAGSLHFTSAKRCNKETSVSWHANMNESKVQPVPTLPDAIACQFSTLEKLVVIYDDHSLYVWNLDDINKVTRCCVLVSHSACIWDIKNLPCENMHDPSLACVAKGCPGGISFATCSADGSIRLWDLATQPNLSEDCKNLVASSSIATKLDCANYHVSAGAFERDSVASGILSPGFRSMAVSSDGKYLATGDCLGNIHIFNLYTSDYFFIQDAHDAEIMSLSFSFTSKKNVVCDEDSEGCYFLASGGQDRMIHIYDVERNFDLIGSVDEHSGSVTSVKFIGNGHKIVSCSIHRSLMLHDLAMTKMQLKISLDHQVASQGSSYDIDIVPSTENALIVAEDKKINALDISSGKLIRSIRHDEDLGYPIKVIVDPSCSFVVCSYSHGSICMYDYLTGEMVARAAGHEGVITGVIFLPNCKHLASVGDDGCIFVWKVPHHLSTRMLQRTKENFCPLALESIIDPVTSCHFKSHQVDDHQCQFHPENLPGKGTPKQANQRHFDQDKGSQVNSAFKFSISRLPKWAQGKVMPPGFLTAGPTSASSKGGQQYFSSSVNCLGDDGTTPCRNNSKSSQHLSWSISGNSSDSDNSQGSSKRQTTHSSFALDNRWYTIHTVCLDILNSPEALEMKGQTANLFLSNNMSQNQPVETTKTVEGITASNTDHIDKNPSTESSFHLTKHTEKENMSLIKYPIFESSYSLCNHMDRSSSLHEKAVLNQKSENSQLAPNKREASLTSVTSASNIAIQQNDLLSLTSSSLSAELKCSHSPKSLQERKSSARKRQLGRFVVRMDLGDERKFGSTFSLRGPVLSNLNATLEDAFMDLPEVLHKTDTSKEDLNNSKVDNQAAVFGAEQTKKESVEQICLEEPKFKRPEEQTIACKNALFELDVAADHALKLFSHLEHLNLRDKITEGSGNQLYTEATEMLLPIARKVRSIAKLVQSTSNNIPSEKHKD